MKHLLCTFVFLHLCILSLFAQTKNGDKFPSFVLVDSIPKVENFLPAPPDTASMNYFNDYVQHQWGKSLRATPRGQQAIADAELDDFEAVLGLFADAFGMKITKADTPEMYNLLWWGKNDAVNATYRVKKSGMQPRKRPYVQFGEGTLVPEEEASHVKCSSYPSNHSAAGWGIALLLVELNPANEDAILKRGYEYGQSRVIAGYHYQSDVDAARLAATAAIARIHAEPFFQKQMQKARKELAKLKR